MARTKITDFWLYRHRYALSYAFLGTILVTLLTLAIFVPGGVSKNEMASAVAADNLNASILIGESPQSIVNAPYHALQKASIALFGVSAVAIKLPSILMAALSILGLYGIIRLWFRANVAFIVALIAACSVQFLLLAQEGAPAIGYLFWNIALLFSISMLTHTIRSGAFWLITTACIAGLSIYTPIQIYLVIGFLIVSLLHPHTRFIVYRRPLWVLVSAFVGFLITLAPLIFNAIREPALLYKIGAIPQDISIINGQYIWNNISQFGDFIRVSDDVFVLPPFGIGLLLVALLGVYRLFTAKYTAKSYILTIWLLIMVPIILLVPGMIGFTLLPIFLLAAFAIDYLIRSWYRLFPRNPYARIAGLIPLAVLLLGLALPSVERFAYGYHYDTRAAQVFSPDVTLLTRELATRTEPITLVVPKDQAEFYSVYAKQPAAAGKLTVTSSLGGQTSNTSTRIIHRDFRDRVSTVPTKVIHSNTTENADRFYLYKTNAN